MLDEATPQGLKAMQSRFLVAKQQQLLLHRGPQAQLHFWRSCQLQGQASTFCSAELLDSEAVAGKARLEHVFVHMLVI